MNLKEMKVFAIDFLNKLAPTAGGAVIIGLRGELGAGKTTFTQICARLLGVSESVTSPTFVILKKYALDKNALGGKFSFFIHIDAYRLKGGKELDVLGWQVIISDPKNLIMIEWPELVSDAMPTHTRYIDFKHVNETMREVTAK